MPNPDRLTRSARLVVHSAWIANRLFLLAVALGLLLSFLFAAAFANLVDQMLPGTDVPSAMAGMRWLMLFGIAMAVATDRLFVALAAIIASADAGDPFVAINAVRLESIGWCLATLQLAEIPGALIASHFPAMGSAAPSGNLSIGGWSIGGWIAVLMVFVLARVFAAGSAMRDELEGTI